MRTRSPVVEPSYRAPINFESVARSVDISMQHRRSTRTTTVFCILSDETMRLLHAIARARAVDFTAFLAPDAAGVASAKDCKRLHWRNLRQPPPVPKLSRRQQFLRLKPAQPLLLSFSF